VQALHDGKSLAIRLSWHDPSKSPDGAWDEWLARIDSLMGDTTTVLRHGPDQMVVQFPLKLTDDGELPYFLQGSTRRPAHLWRWSSTPDSLEVGSATGLGRFVPRAGPISHVALFDNGEWQLQLTRALVPADSANAPVFAPGRTVPIGFFAADGSSGEDLVRGSISAWYSIYLDVPVPMRVYVQPVVAVLLTAGLGLLVVVRAQRRERRTGGNNLEAQ
jgi:DMSO reductase family type II enzyme heme b subunit